MRYIVTAFVFFGLAGILALLMRIQLARPENHFLGPDLYNQFFTVHGTTMMFLFAVPMMEGIGLVSVPLGTSWDGVWGSLAMAEAPCLELCQWRLQFEDIGLQGLLLLTFEVIRENMSGFFIDALLPNSAAEGSQSTSSS